MNENSASPGNPADDPEAIRLPPRLRQIERRLKQAIPRLPVLDAAALEELARAASPVAPRRREPVRRRARSWATVAAVWACGALVGSIATRLLMSRPGVDDGSIRPVAQSEERAPAPAKVEGPSPAVAPPVERGESSPPPTPVESATESALLASLVDPSGGDLLWRRIEGATLRAGTHFRKDTSGASNILSSTTVTARQAPPAKGSPQGKVQSGLEPTPSAVPEVTRERMLDNMLREMSGAVL